MQIDRLTPQIDRLTSQDQDWILQAAGLLTEAFPHSWPDEQAGLAVVHQCLEEGKIAFVAVVEEQVAGFIGAMPQYGQTGWELHPLVVAQHSRRQGIGAALIHVLEREVAARGGITLYLGSDDEQGKTSLAYCDLYDHLWERIRDIRNLKNHPYEFYQKMGYQIVGVFPDVNGVGKPDIWLAKRLISD